MDHLENFGDRRQLSACVHCGASTGSRDHVPSKVFLDKPYPTNLPVVDICSNCNQKFSIDEQYVACLLECVVSGSTNPAHMERRTIARTIERRPDLRARLERAKLESKTRGGGTILVWRPEADRVENVIVKLARGHALFEVNEPMRDDPSHIAVVPLHLMDPDERDTFEERNPITLAAWPEVGSRAMQRLAAGTDLVDGWIEVQRGRYRYYVDAADTVTVRMVIRDYLAAEVTW